MRAMGRDRRPRRSEGGAGRWRPGRRPAGGLTRAWVALAVVALVVPLLGLLWRPPAALAQEEPPIVPVVSEDAVAVVEGEPAADPGLEAAPVDDGSVAYQEVAPVEAVAPDPAVAPAETTGLVPPPSVAAAPVVDWAPPRTVYIPETGQSVDGVFLDVWRAWGGALSWGNPITPELEQNGRIVQYYAYGRFEYVPDDPGGNVVHFGDLGAETRPYLLRRGGAPGGTSAAADAAAAAARAWLPLDPEAVEPDGPEWRFVPETGHGVAGAFKAFWEATGEAGYLGNPLSEPYQSGSLTVQVFERGKLVQEPGGSPYLLPIGELMAARWQLDTTPVAQGDLPAYSEDLFVPPPTPVLTPAGTTPQVDPNAEKWFQVSISQQYGIARQGDVILWEGYVSTGKERFETPTGTFFVNSKLPVQDMEGVLGGEYYNVPEVPDVMYFTDRGHAIHGTYWHNNFGVPMSHGCINLPMDVADWMYQWAPVGMRVEIVP